MKRVEGSSPVKEGFFHDLLQRRHEFRAGDDNNVPDVFVHDRKKDTTILISKAADGTLGNGESYEPAISGNGKYVAFTSWASNLVPGDGNGLLDSFAAPRYDWLV